ncbi:MAG: hypothetical protein LUC49_06145 [Prevotella sp.]|nr:hypothetical protein [Prevotella sp.]
MNKIILLLFLALLPVAQGWAQSRKAKAQPVKTPEEALYDELLLSTAKVMFIDSIVADKDSFLTLIPLPEDAGTLSIENGRAAYTNSFADTRLFASGDTISGQHLYISRRYGNEWDVPAQLSELDNEKPDYPFLMADGITLYFSAEGEGTAGGRDIFRTIYNTDDLAFYEATNIGLPFNSPANDYLLAISDIDNIGWLVTDRRQEEGKVCIYTFSLPAQRVAFDEDTPEDELRSFAEIRQISDTWAFGDIAGARQRLQAITSRTDTNEDEGKIMFVVNDRTVYTSPDDFSSDDARRQFSEIEQSKKKIAALESLIESMRKTYSSTPPAKRYSAARKIAELEKETDALRHDTAQAEKELRNNENK